MKNITCPLSNQPDIFTKHYSKRRCFLVTFVAMFPDTNVDVIKSSSILSCCDLKFCFLMQLPKPAYMLIRICCSLGIIWHQLLGQARKSLLTSMNWKILRPGSDKGNSEWEQYFFILIYLSSSTNNTGCLPSVISCDGCYVGLCFPVLQCQYTQTKKPPNKWAG